MSGRFSRGRRYSRSRSYKAWPKRSSLIRRSMGNMRAAKRQNDLSNTTISGSSLAYQLVVPANKDFGYQSFNIWDALNGSPMFRTLRQCYDQIRINNIKVKFSLLQALTMTGTNCPVFATVWDRNGFHPDQYKPDTEDFMDGSNLDWEWETFASYSSFDKRSMSSGSAFNATVSIYPSNMAEKSMYISTMDISSPEDDGSKSSDICSPLSNPALPFKPQIVTGIFVARAIASQSFVFSVDWEIDASFRGMHASTSQAPTRAELINHFIVGNTNPSTQGDMEGSAFIGLAFTRAVGSGNVTIPAQTSGLILNYNPVSNLWQVILICNDHADGAVTHYVASGQYYYVGFAKSKYVHFGKGNAASDKIILTSEVIVPEGEVAISSMFFNSYVINIDTTVPA